MSEIICKGCAHYQRTPIAVNDIGGGAYETACGLGKEDEFFTEEGCSEYESPRLHGEWRDIVCDDGYGEYTLNECNQCGNLSARRRKYCAECGAKMDNPEEVSE